MKGLTWGLLIVLLLLAAAHRSNYHQAYVAADPAASIPYGDSIVYLDEARRDFASDERSAFYKHPIYSYLVHRLDASSPEGLSRVRDLQWVLGLGTLVLVFFIAHAHGGAIAAFLAFVLLALHAPLLFEESKLLDTTVGVFTIVLAVAGLDAWFRDEARGTVRVCGCGLLFGVAALARSPTLLAVLLFVPFVVGRGGWRGGVGFVFGVACVVAPITWRNYRAEGDLVVVNASDAFTYLAGNNETSVGIYSLPPGYPDGVLQERVFEKELARRQLGREPTLFEQRRLTYARAFDFYRAHPERFVPLLGAKLRFALSSYEVDDNYSLLRERERFGLMWGGVVSFRLLLLLALLGGLLVGKGRATLFIPIFVTFVVLLVFYVTSRFRLPATPFLAILAGIGVSRLFDAEVSLRRKYFAAGVAVVAAVALSLTRLPVPEEELRRSEAYFSEGFDLYAARRSIGSGDLEGAARILASGVAASAFGSPRLEEDLHRLIRDAPFREVERLIDVARDAARVRGSESGERVDAVVERAVADR